MSCTMILLLQLGEQIISHDSICFLSLFLILLSLLVIIHRVDDSPPDSPYSGPLWAKQTLQSIGDWVEDPSDTR